MRVQPGAVAIWGPWPFVSDLRTGAMSGGSGEQALITAACAQMGHFYQPHRRLGRRHVRFETARHPGGL